MRGERTMVRKIQGLYRIYISVWKTAENRQVWKISRSSLILSPLFRYICLFERSERQRLRYKLLSRINSMERRLLAYLQPNPTFNQQPIRERI
jgi:hypothetical protein